MLKHITKPVQIITELTRLAAHDDRILVGQIFLPGKFKTQRKLKCLQHKLPFLFENNSLGVMIFSFSFVFSYFIFMKTNFMIGIRSVDTRLC